MLEKTIVPQIMEQNIVHKVTPGRPQGVKCASAKAGMCGKACVKTNMTPDLDEFVEKLRPDKKYLYLHIIALGSGEAFGPNINGDYFPEEGLIKHHNTFVTHAKHYKHHINKNPKISYGHPVFSTYNKPMRRVELILAVDKEKAPDLVEKFDNGDSLGYSMACFPAGTARVKMADGQEKLLEDVQIGDLVVTHTGNVEAVTNTMNREYTGSIVQFRQRGLPDELISTDQHKIWARPSITGKTRCPVCCESFQNLASHMHRQSDPQHEHAYSNYGKYVEGMTPANKLKDGDFVRTPFDTEVYSHGNKNYAALLGYYLARGSAFIDRQNRQDHYTEFAFYSNGQDYVDEVVALLKAEGCRRISVHQQQPETATQAVRVYDHGIRNRLLKDTGSAQGYLGLSQIIMKWAPSTQLHILNRYVDCCGVYNKTKHTFSATTKSRKLAFQLASIAWRNGICLDISCVASDNYRETIYTLTISVNEITAKMPVYALPVSNSKTNILDNCQVPDNQWSATGCNEISSQTEVQPRDDAAAQKVSTKLRYIEDGFVYRRVRGHKEGMFTGTVYNISVANDESYVVNNIAVSNCKIPQDYCSICNNAAKNKSEYCSHIRNELLDYKDDGRQVYMINREPTFFDISYVLRPADKTAMLLRKVASENDNDSKVKYAEIYKKLDKVDKIKDNKALDKQGVLHKKINVTVEPILDEDQQSYFKKTAMSLLDADLPTLPLTKLANHTFDDIISTVSLSGIMLKKAEYLHLLSKYKRPHESILKQADISPDHFSDDIYKTIEPYVPCRSAYSPWITQRLEKIAGLHVANPITGTDYDLGMTLPIVGGAAAYAAYKKGLSGKLLDGILGFIKKYPGRFVVMAGLGSAAFKVNDQMGKSLVTDSISARQAENNGWNIERPGIKTSSTLNMDDQTGRSLLEASLQPFGIVYINEFAASK